MVETGLGEMGLYMGAGLAVGLGAIATGIAQKEIGAAAVGATAENPELLGKSLLLTVIPETNVVFGMVVGLILIFLA